MRSCPVILLLVVGWGLCSSADRAESPRSQADEARISALIAQLGSEPFTEREAASQALDALGPPALEALQQAARSDDVEVRRRSLEIIAGIEKRVESAQLLAPRRVQVIFKDRPVGDAVAEFAKQTGFPIQIDKASTGHAVAGRKITLDTGKISFWEAYERFCREAGLVEELPKPVAQPAVNPYRSGDLVFVDGRYGPRPAGMSNPIGLVVGKPDVLPTFKAGAVRVRALPPQTEVTGEAKAEGEALFALEVTPDPALPWHGIVGMRVTKAVDENGYQLSQPSLFVGQTLPQQDTVTWVIVSSDSLGAAPVVRDPRQVPVRLRLNRTGSKMLKELGGVLAARVQTPPQPLITVSNVLAATGQSFKGRYGGSLRVLDVQRPANKQIRVHVKVEGPPADSSGFAPGMGPGCAMLIVPEVAVRDSAAPQLTLLDAKGQAYRLIKTDGQNVTPNANGLVQEFSLTYEAQGDQGEAAQLVFTGTRMATVDIPFTLKDVPLP